MLVRMLALDLDGTLLRMDKTISERTIRALNACRRKGIKIVLATARSERVAQRVTNLIQPDGVISSGGAKVTAHGTVICARKLSVQQTQAIINACCSKDMRNLSVEAEEGTFVTWTEPKHPDHAHAVHWDFIRPLGCAAYKISVELECEADARSIREQFPQCVMHGFSGEKWYRIACKGADKLSGIQALNAYWNINLADVVAFGDDWTDLEMVRCCGTGVAVANAIPEVKAAADVITAANEADGVALWLENYID